MNQIIDISKLVSKVKQLAEEKGLFAFGTSECAYSPTGETILIQARFGHESHGIAEVYLADLSTLVIAELPRHKVNPEIENQYTGLVKVRPRLVEIYEDLKKDNSITKKVLYIQRYSD